MKIAVLDDWANVARDYAPWDTLEAELHFFDAPIPAAELAATLASFDVVCLMRERTPFPASLIGELPALKLIVTSGPRNLSIDVAAAKAHGITVCGTQSRKTTTSELALAMMLNQCRRIGEESARLADGGFQGAPGRDLADLSVGLVGLGNVGGQVAALCRAFGSTVLAWSPNLDDERAAAQGVERAASLEALAERADVLSIHMVLSERSAELVGRDALAALPAGALVVNTSRAGLLDRQALFEWLDRDGSARAAIDVFECEPLPGNDPWREAKVRFGERLLLTPHLGYVTQATWRLFHEQTVEAIAAFAAGVPIRPL